MADGGDNCVTPHMAVQILERMSPKDSNDVRQYYVHGWLVRAG